MRRRKLRQISLKASGFFRAGELASKAEKKFIPDVVDTFRAASCIAMPEIFAAEACGNKQIDAPPQSGRAHLH